MTLPMGRTSEPCRRQKSSTGSARKKYTKKQTDFFCQKTDLHICNKNALHEISEKCVWTSAWNECACHAYFPVLPGGAQLFHATPRQKCAGKSPYFFREKSALQMPPSFAAYAKVQYDFPPQRRGRENSVAVALSQRGS